MSFRSNEAERRRELTQSMGWRSRLATASELAATAIFRLFGVAGVGF